MDTLEPTACTHAEFEGFKKWILIEQRRRRCSVCGKIVVISPKAMRLADLSFFTSIVFCFFVNFWINSVAIYQLIIITMIINKILLINYAPVVLHKESRNLSPLWIVLLILLVIILLFKNIFF